MTNADKEFALQPGQYLDEYLLDKVLSADNSGITYLAKHIPMGNRVAIKEYLPDELSLREGSRVHPRSDDCKNAFESGLARFLDRGRMIQHHNAGGGRHCFRANGTAYLVMDYEEGASSLGEALDAPVLPEPLRAFVTGRPGEEILDVTKAAKRLEVSLDTVYDWTKRHLLIAWQSTERKLSIPAAQIVGPGKVVPGLADVVEAVGDPELAWAFLSQEWPFDETAERPLDRLNNGRLDDVLYAAAGFGSAFT